MSNRGMRQYRFPPCGAHTPVDKLRAGSVRRFSARRNSFPKWVLKAHGFRGCGKNLRFVSGHGFSRAAMKRKKDVALATEVGLSNRGMPQYRFPTVWVGHSLRQAQDRLCPPLFRT
jgi:hypothetical protein